MSKPILIIGCGINGVAIARQLLMNGQSVVLVDRADIASGATAYSSRLIHGGLRYLEYAEIALVRESLRERGLLLNLAPQFVRPLRLYIPTRTRFGGILSAVRTFLGWRSARGQGCPRGAWIVRIGLFLYDMLAWSDRLPRHRGRRIGAVDSPPVNAARYRYLANYYDAQIAYPERFVIGMIHDCERLANDNDLSFELCTYHDVSRSASDQITLTPNLAYPAANVRSIRPAAVVNATGASVDDALHRIDVASDRLMGGTKGSHLFTFHSGLRETLRSGGVYAEADDGRPVFLLPLERGCLIGTTDIFYEGDPATVHASSDELDYLVDVVNQLFPQIEFERNDIEFHYCGVRPLPYLGEKENAAAVTRSHVFHEHDDQPWPMMSVIGGKLTTCRSLSEEAVNWLARRLSFPITTDGRNRSISESFPSLFDQTDIDAAAVDEVIRVEHVRTLCDLVERRLMMLYDPKLSKLKLRWLAERLVANHVIEANSIDDEVSRTVTRLETMYGKSVV